MTVWTLNLYIFIAAVAVTIFLAQIRKPKNYFIEILKNFIGSYFIFSGVVKAIDPVGTGIKMEEYFEIFHQYFPFLNFLWDMLEPASLGFSIFMILLEIILGLFLIFGALPQLTTYLIFATVIFFTFLTGFSHITGKVTDCGCFGDFIKLTPKISFIKDVILLLLLLPLVKSWKSITTLFPVKPRFLSLFLLSILAIVFTLRNVYYEPVVDFRAYQPGVNITECLALPKDAKPTISVIYYTMENSVTKESKKISSDDYLKTEIWKDTTWKITHSGEPVIIQKGDEPKCKDFAISDENNSDVTATYMTEEQPIFVLIIPYLDRMNHKNLVHIKDVLDAARKDGHYAIALTGSGIADTKKVLNAAGIDVDVFNTDATPLKTIMRSNPGILVLKKGTILGKYHHNEEVSYKKIKEELGI